METINGYYLLNKHRKNINIRIFADDLTTESKINELINHFGLCKLRIKISSYINEKDIKATYTESNDINDFTNELKKLNIDKVENIDKWRFETIETM